MTACGGVELSFQATFQYDNFQFFKGLALRAPSPNFCPIQALLEFEIGTKQWKEYHISTRQLSVPCKFRQSLFVVSSE